MLVGGLRAPGAIATRLVGLVVLVAAVALACAGILSLAEDGPAVADAVLTLAGTGVLVGFALAPVMSAADDPLDPRRFAVLGLDARQLTGPLALASLVSVPTVALLAVEICTAIAWSRLGVPSGVAILAALVHAATCILLARLSMAFGALVLRGRRTRELSSLFVLGIVVVVLPVAVFFASLEWRGRVPSQLQAVVEVLAVTPIGAAAGLPGAVALGQSPTAGLAAVVALLTLAGAAALWAWSVRRMLARVDAPLDERDRGGLGWFAVTPATPGGAIAARSIIYWFGDSRHLVNLGIIPVVGLLPIVPLLVAGVPAAYAALVPVPIMALFLGWVSHNDVAYDSSAIWMHVTAGVRGVADRVGRLVPVLIAGITVLAIAIPVATAAYGRWALMPAIAGVAASLFLTGLGLSSMSSVLAPYPVPRPGDSPFRQPQRTGSSGVVAQALVMLGALALSAPTLWLAWRALTEDISLALTAQWMGLATGVVVLVAGVAIGSLLWDRRSYQIMEFAATT
ncbi:hypothetical protein [Microbacterium sp. Marseille-Q6965]|uniref:hypothetical protein n=1 Tax=Microbacterium sp. Marseille-Q6965 TaxID=2965072 RepID=UPI0021B74A67|nr:hypothetical protein [Microbacterium sp. Marseille-Q6965]